MGRKSTESYKHIGENEEETELLETSVDVVIIFKRI